jgi:hypothetical protein
MVDEVYEAWRQDVLAGRASLMVSASAAEVAALSSRARLDRLAAGEVEPDGLPLHDGNRAGRGDVVVTRANRRLLTVRGGRDFVKNGDLWQVTERLPNGDLTVRSLNHAGQVRLPAAYAAAHVELGYATTVHRAQGMTVDTSHVLVDKTMCRESLYVAMSRGRLANRAYVVTDEVLEIDLHVPPGPRLDGPTVLQGVLAREGSERSATETLRDTLESAESLATLVPRYVDALTRAVITAELEEAVRAGLRDAGGRALEQSAAEAPGWRQLLLACAGERPRERVAEAVRSRLLDAAEVQDLAAVLAWRVARLDDVGQPRAKDDAARFRPPWLMPSPPGLASDPVGVWARLQDRLVMARVESLVEQLATDALEWAHGIRPRPETGPARDAWERDAALVVAYRDQHRLPNGAGPLGQRPPGVRGDGGYAAVQAAWQRLLPERTPVAAPAGSVNERLQALSRRPVPARGEPALQVSSRAGRTPPEPPPPRPAHTQQGSRW